MARNPVANLPQQLLDKDGSVSQPWMQFFSNVGEQKKQLVYTNSGANANITGLIGTPAILASSLFSGPFVWFAISFSGGSTALGGSLTLPYYAEGVGSAEFWNTDTQTLLGTGLIMDKTLSFPNWVSVSNVAVHGMYVVRQ